MLRTFFPARDDLGRTNDNRDTRMAKNYQWQQLLPNNRHG